MSKTRIQPILGGVAKANPFSGAHMRLEKDLVGACIMHGKEERRALVKRTS
jgi:hypothetical protein